MWCVQRGGALWALIGCWLIMGCADSVPPEKPMSEAEIQEALKDLEERANLDGAEPEDPPKALLGDPLGCVKRTLTALAEGRPAQAYDFLPASYHREVDELIREAAGKLDRETWTAAFNMLQKTTQVMKAKKEWVLPLVQASLGQAVPAEGETSSTFAENWDSLVRVVELLVQSELSDHARMQRFSAREFLETTGREVFAVIRAADEAGSQLLRDLPQTRVELVSHKGNSAVLRLQRPNDAEPVETPFVYREGRWIQKALADNWSQSIQQVRAVLDTWTPERMAQLQAPLRGQLRTIEQTLDKMLAAERMEDFQALVLPLLQQLQMLRQIFTPQAGPPAGVTLTIPYELDEEQQTRLLRTLEQLTDDPQKAEFTMYPGNGRTEIILKPVADVAQFAERLTFAPKRSVNVAARTIQLEWPRE